jgi:hypothetical protein
MTEQNESTKAQQPAAKPLCTPWSLHFDRDGTEDYGIICDAEGNDLVASHLPQTRMPRWKDREFGEGCFWLPEEEGDEMPVLVRQMQVMTAAPKLLEMLKIAVATADPARHTWVKEAQEAIAEAAGQPFDAREAEAARHLNRAAPRMYDALQRCEVMLKDYFELAKVVDSRLGPRAVGATDEIEQVRWKAFATLCEARGKIAF